MECIDGDYRGELRAVHPSRTQAARGYWPGTGDRFEIRSQSLKLRFWDERHTHPTGVLVDLSYESIRALAGSGIHEMRLDDTVGGQSNIRIVFFDPPRG